MRVRGVLQNQEQQVPERNSAAKLLPLRFLVHRDKLS